jgi:hypothetical protein
VEKLEPPKHNLKKVEELEPLIKKIFKRRWKNLSHSKIKDFEASAEASYHPHRPPSQGRKTA